MAMAAVLRREGRRLTQPITALQSSLISQSVFPFFSSFLKSQFHSLAFPLSQISNFYYRSYTLIGIVFFTETKPRMARAPFPPKWVRSVFFPLSPFLDFVRISFHYFCVFNCVIVLDLNEC